MRNIWFCITDANILNQNRFRSEQIGSILNASGTRKEGLQSRVWEQPVKLTLQKTTNKEKLKDSRLLLRHLKNQFQITYLTYALTAKRALKLKCAPNKNQLIVLDVDRHFARSVVIWNCSKTQSLDHNKRQFYANNVLSR